MQAMAQPSTHDRDLRTLLLRLLAGSYGDDPTTVVVEEMGILWGDRRVDVSVINGELHGYEIKSDADDLSRLADQAAAYARVFDRLTLVVGERHLTAALGLLPKWWGITMAHPAPGGLTLVEKRRARLCPDRDSQSIARLLWRDEAIAILEERGCTVNRRQRRLDVQDQVARDVPFDELRTRVRAALKSRQGWRAAAPPS
jgi:hypothetical protein